MTVTYLRLREVLQYDPDTGVFVWLVSTSNRVKVGAVAGRIRSDGSVRIGFDGRLYLAHRLAWFSVHGCWPSAELDHLNRNPEDNRLCNLREATKTQNMWNTKRRCDNSTGFKGVIWSKQKRKFQARITINGEPRHLGFFDDPSRAHAAYVSAAQRHFGEFARAA